MKGRAVSPRVRFALAASVVIAAGGVVLAPPALATQALDHASNAYYIESASTSEAGTDGCNDGTAVKNNSWAHYYSLLDFGAQQTDGSGTILISDVDVSNSQVEAIAEAYASNWYRCVGSDNSALDAIFIGTNDSNNAALTTANGGKWADVLFTLDKWAHTQGYDSQLDFWDASDMEPGFDSGPASTITWMNGYVSEADDNVNSGSSAPDSYLFTADYGSADGCPETTHTGGNCNDGWTQQTEYNLAWAISFQLPLPEIYYSVNADQWEQIDLYGVNNDTQGAMDFWGPMTEHALDGSSLSDSDAWNDLWGDLNAHTSTAQSLSDNATLEDE